MIRNTLRLLPLVILFGTASAQDAPSWMETRRISDRAVVGMGFSPDGRHLAVSGLNFGAVYDLATWKTAGVFQQYGLVDEALYNPEGSLLITRSSVKDVLIHDAGTHDQVKFAMETAYERLAPPPTHQCPAAFTKDGRWLVLANAVKGVRFWNLEGLSGKRKFIFETGTTDLPLPDRTRVLLPHVNAFAPLGREMWLGFEGGYVYPVGLQDAEESLRVFREEPRPDTGTINRENVERAARSDRNIYRTPGKARLFRPHAKSVSSLEFIGSTLVTAGWEGEVKVWTDLAALRELHDPRKNETVKKAPDPARTLPGYYVSLSPDGNTLAVAEAWKIRTYDAKTLKPLSEIAATPTLGRPVRIRFSPDSASMAVTHCACTDCVDDHVLHLTSAPPKRVHHHGGTMILYRRAEATPTR